MQLQTVFKNAKAAKFIYRAINHKLRQQILLYLESHPRTTVTALYVHFRLEQSVASQHLAILRKQELVTTERNGKEILYSVNKDRMAEVKWVTELLLKIKTM